ncbi:hypothetical protein [Dawidia soli]|uniref:Uncharacterized protein n=1 Tax=Dawidia soli TaxID=2782352 RepID=A0AAP2GED0_9BACT|nr:hypothetical protein [Dawidia soli]MBT1688249.1 hypothetical protein [Dawidia soli]
MKRTDHILAFTTTLLRASDADVERLLATMEKIYSLHQARKPGAVSLGAEQGDTEETFAPWLRRLRSEQIQEVHVSYHAFDERDDMPAHMAAAFAGIPDLLLRVRTARQTAAYALNTYFCPQYALTPQQFITLLNSQPDNALLWDRAAELILESNGMNNRSVFEPEETPEYLLSPEGRHVFEYLAPDLIKEIQIECTVRGRSFVIPDELKGLFVKYDYSFFDEDREYVYLYPLGDVSAQEILDLVHAQPFGMKTWETLNTTLQEYDDPSVTIVAPDQWEKTLRGMSREDLERIVHPLCRSICTLCEAGGQKPVIPAALADSFGPDEEEQKRAAARSKDKDRWNLQPTQEPWEHYAFRPAENAPPFTPATWADTQRTFIQSLEAIHAFAARIQSPFQEAFGLSLFVLQSSLPAGRYDAAHMEEMVAQLSKAGFSEQAIENFHQAAWVGELCTELGWEPARIHGMLAAKFADVFGGMGSWNDQYIEEDHDTYQKVSSELFEALKRYQASLL